MRYCSIAAQNPPDPVQMRPSSNQMQSLLVPYGYLSPLALESGCSGLLIHRRRRGHRSPPLPLVPLSRLFVCLLSGRSTTVVLRRCGIPLHKLTLEKRGEIRVGHKMQVLENCVGVCLGKAIGASPAPMAYGASGNKGDKVLGNLWHRWECRINRACR